MKRSNGKLRLLYLLMLFVALLVIGNVTLVTVLKYHIRSNTSLKGYIDTVSNADETIFASRGTIYDSNGIVVAQDTKTFDIICYLDESRPSNGNVVAYVDNPSFLSQALAPILDVDANDIYSIIMSGKENGLYQTELGAAGRNLTEEQRDQILSIEGLHGVDFRNSYKREYPLGETFSPQIVGFAKSNDEGKLVGQLGIELYLDDELSGTDGYHSFQQDKNGYVLPGMREETVDAINGYDVYLTIDSSIQEALNTCLQTTMEFKNASRAWGSVVEINTGKILAWGQTPSFDPNNIKSNDVQVNYGSQLAYEPGSVMKAVIYSAAMDLGVYDGDAYFDSSPYCYTASAGRTYAKSPTSLGCIYNVSKLDWGTIPLDYGLIYSSNVATATLLSQYVGIENYKTYLDRFHLYQKVFTDGIDEISGYTNYGLSPADNITATYGQGSSTTMLQLLQAYTAIFGKGEMLKPYCINKIVDPNTNNVIYQSSKTVVDTPISEQTAKNMQDLLRRVVSDPEGTCRHYAAKTVEVMGKTGTSEIPLDGGYAENENIISCMLGFPYDDPQYMVYFAYVSPETVYYNYDIKPIPDLIDRIALLQGLIVNEDAASEDKVKYINKYSMPYVVDKSVNDGQTVLEEKELEVIVIGDGAKIVDQYPKDGADVYTNERVFILTDYNNIYLPDFSDWTRKELIEYWRLSKLPITINGYGVVKSQSISPNTIVDSKSEIAVQLEKINYIEPVAQTENKDNQEEQE